MKLKNKIFILIIGILIIPLFVIALIGYIDIIIFEKHIPYKKPNYFVIRGWLTHKFPEEYKKAYPNLDKINIPFSIPIIILNEKNEVILSNIPKIKTGYNIKDANYIFKSINDLNSSELIIRPLYVNGEVIGKAIYQLNISNKKKFYHITKIFERAAYPIIAIIIFSSIMIILIENSLLRSIRTLEEATRRIAQGDLDFKLEPKGKDEIASLTRSFDTMRHQLKENHAQRARFLMAVSHDLKTPLTSIWGYLEAIKDGMAKTPETINKYLKIIFEKSKILEDRIVQLIDFARMETDEWRLQFKNINLRNFLKSISIIYDEDAVLYKRKFYSKIDIPENLTIKGDKNLLFRAFENLFSNALRYTKKNDSILLSAKKDNGKVTINLSDTGKGISDDDLSHIFEPFYRGTNSRNEPGTGLGLSIVKSIFNAHGWDVNVSSTPGKGTEFIITINLS